MLRRNSPGTIALDPSILGEDETIQLLTKVLNHVVSLRFTMDQEIKADFLLEADNSLNLLLDELFVLLRSEFAFAKLGTSKTDLLGLLKTKH